MTQRLPFKKGQWVTVQRTGGEEPLREATVHAIYEERGFTQTNLVLELRGVSVPSELVHIHKSSFLWRSKDDEYRGEYRIVVREKKIIRIGKRCCKV